METMLFPDRKKLLLVLAAALVPGEAAAAGAGAWNAVAAHPDRFMGLTVSLDDGYCGTGGPEGKNPELTQCSFGKGRLFVRSRTVVFSGTAAKRMKGCGGLDVYEESPFCRFVVRFVPDGLTRSAATTGDARIPLLETKLLTLK